jgi:hypothetical protein
MKQYTLLYAIIFLLIIFVFIYINKKIILEGYTYNKDLTFNNNPQPLVSFNQVHESTCMIDCNSRNDCVGFTSNIEKNSNVLGNCSLYNHSSHDTDHLSGTNFYIK